MGQSCGQSAARTAVGCDGAEGRITSWRVTQVRARRLADWTDAKDARVALVRNFEFGLPLKWLLAAPLEIEKVRGLKSSDVLTVRLRLAL